MLAVRVGQILFAIGCFIPGAGLVAIVGNLMALSESVHRSVPTMNYESLIPAAVGTLLIAFIQIAMGIAVAIMTSKRADLSSAAKLGWTLGCLFVGTIALPLFLFMVVLRPSPIPAESAQAPLHH
jgi:hypothetical protein